MPFLPQNLTAESTDLKGLPIHWHASRLYPFFMAVAVYEPRYAPSTPLYFLVDSLYEKVKAVWEEHFQHAYGFWRGFFDEIVARYLECGLAECGFARFFCDQCND